ncbi:MAG: DUF58 domain-containing protein [Candidatus Cloacimonetes bacterium]|nr:DUF58 domain-containing protein [Candidatus Cloacimonadota bacterium]
MNNKDFLNPEIVAKLDRFEIRARLIVEGFITGLHKSPYHGFSVEFLEHREYLPGDSIKHIDWKVFAKSDRYFIKKFEEETNLKAYILIDCSKSMGFTSQKISKLEYGKTLASALSYLMISQQDAVGLLSFSEEIRSYIPPRSAKTHLNTLFHELADLIPQYTTNTAAILHNLADRIKKRGLIILISDLLDEPEEIMMGLQHFRHQKHEVVVFHLLDKQELNFKYNRKTKFIDMETGEELITQPWEIKKMYLKKMEEMKKFFSSKCHNSYIDYVPINTSTPYDKALFAYLIKRQKLL